MVDYKILARDESSGHQLLLDAINIGDVADLQDSIDVLDLVSVMLAPGYYDENDPFWNATAPALLGLASGGYGGVSNLYNDNVTVVPGLKLVGPGILTLRGVAFGIAHVILDGGDLGPVLGGAALGGTGVVEYALAIPAGLHTVVVNQTSTPRFNSPFMFDGGTWTPFAQMASGPLVLPGPPQVYPGNQNMLAKFRAKAGDRIRVNVTTAISGVAAVSLGIVVANNNNTDNQTLATGTPIAAKAYEATIGTDNDYYIWATANIDLNGAGTWSVIPSAVHKFVANVPAVATGGLILLSDVITQLGALQTSYNDLLAKMKTAGEMVPD